MKRIAAFVAALCLALPAYAQQSSWLWWGATNPVPVSAANPLPVTGAGAPATSLTVGTTTIVGGTTLGLLYDNAGVLGNLATGNNGILVTDGSGHPSISTTFPTALFPLVAPDGAIALEGSDATSGFGLAATTGLPQMVDGSNGLTIATSNHADDYQGSQGVQVLSTQSFFGIAIGPLSGSGTGYLDVNSYGTNYPTVVLTKALGTRVSPLPITNGTIIGEMQFAGQPDTVPGDQNTSASILASAAQDFATAQGTQLFLRTTSLGNFSRDNRLIIDGAGNTNVENGSLVVGNSIPTNCVSATAGNGCFGGAIFVGTPSGTAPSAGDVDISGSFKVNGVPLTSGSTVNVNTSSLIETRPNDTSTGSAANKLVVYTSAAQVKTAAVTDTSDVFGICVSGIAGTSCGTSGNASVAIAGQASCAFDGATTAGDFVVASTSVAGDCSDAGATVPATVQVLGYVLSTNGGAGTYAVDISNIGAMAALNAKAQPGGTAGAIQYNSSNKFGGAVITGIVKGNGTSAPAAAVAADLPATTLATGTSVSLSTPREYYVCTSTCTVTPPVPAAGYEFCVLNDDNVATVITLAALGSSARYENTGRTAYGTAGTGTFISGGAAGDKVCIVGRDSTHYLTTTFNGTWTAN